MTDKVMERFREMRWRYGDKDPSALASMEDRIAETARKRALITYSDLVRGIRFSLPNLTEKELTIDVSDWRELDRAVVGDFLGYIS